MSFTTRFHNFLDDLSCALGQHKRRHAHFRDYCSALVLPIERKSIEPMAAAMDPQNVRARHQSLHNFVSSIHWSDRAVLDQVSEQIIENFPSGEEVYWLVDDTGIPKKGQHSVGVAHQYCGQLGKQCNSQVAVSLSIACESASLPIDYRLYLPKSWAEDAERREKAGVPEDIEFLTKPQICIEQIRAAVARGVEPGIVCADAGYGYDSVFRDSLEELGLEYAVGIQPATRVARSSDVLTEALTVEELADSLDRRSFTHVKWRSGTNAALHAWFARVRVRAVVDENKRGKPRADQWLMIERPPGGSVKTRYFLLTLPASVTLERMVFVTKMRWRIERDYQELKQEVGLNHFEGRSWTGFHHHATLCIATYAFLILERLRHPGRKKNLRRPKPPAISEDYIPRGSPAHAEAR